MSERFAPTMNESDAVMWTIERDPSLRTTIVAVLLLDRSPDWEILASRVRRAAEEIPRLRQRVAAAPLRLGPPRWVEADDLDLGYHLRHVIAPPPGDLRVVLDLASTAAMAAFDKDRPLWEMTLVDGLAGGQAAVVLKVHHAFTDGVGAMRMAKLLFDTERTPAAAEGEGREAVDAGGSDRTHDVHRDPISLAVGAVTDDLRAALRVTRAGSESLPRLAWRTGTHPLRATEAGVRTVRSVGRLLAPVREPRSPVMRGRSLGRRLDAFDVQLEGLLAAAHAAEATINDAFLAAVTGGMRRYHELHGEPVDALRVTMPINRRRETDTVGDNRFTPARFSLPIAEPDPRVRMRTLGELARSWRHEPALPLTDVISGVLNRLPPLATTGVLGSMLKAIDFVATNVPGMTRPVYLAGAEIVREYAFAPPGGSAFSVALLSHVGTCCLGINADTGAVPDPDVLTACLMEGFDEVLAVAPGERQRPSRALSTAQTG